MGKQADEQFATPDVTKAQAAAVAMFVAGPIAAKQAGIDDPLLLLAVIISSAVVSVVWILADAQIRGNRAGAAGE